MRILRRNGGRKKEDLEKHFEAQKEEEEERDNILTNILTYQQTNGRAEG